MGRKIALSLHIGVHKTASTHLQQTISANRDVLGSFGVQALLPAQLRKPGKTIEARFQLNLPPERRDPPRVLLRRNSHRGTTRLLLSEENFIGRIGGAGGTIQFPLYPEASDNVARLVQAVAPVPVDLFIAIREPTAYLRSCFSQVFSAGRLESPGPFFLGAEPERVDWVDLVTRLRAVEGLRWLGVWPYEAYPDNTTWIFRRMLRWRLGKLLIPPLTTVNEGFSERAVEEALLAIDRGEQTGPLYGFRELFPVGPDNPPFDPFPEDVRQASQAAYARQIEHIRGMEGVIMLDGPPAPLASQPA